MGITHITVYEGIGYRKVLQHRLPRRLLTGHNNQSLEVTLSCFRT
jgi:hypothetical protein